MWMHRVFWNAQQELCVLESAKRSSCFLKNATWSLKQNVHVARFEKRNAFTLHFEKRWAFMLHYEKHNVLTLYFKKAQIVHIVGFENAMRSRCVWEMQYIHVFQNSQCAHSLFLKCPAFTLNVFKKGNVSALRLTKTQCEWIVFCKMQSIHIAFWLMCSCCI